MDNDTKIIAVANHKGGCGKTTTVVNLAAEFGRAGKSVLVVDLDPQANASEHIGLAHPSEVLITSAELLLGEDDMLMSAINTKTRLENVSLIYGKLALGQTEDMLREHASRPSEELSRKLELLNGAFDIILIDCPPSLRLLTANALAAATHVIVPVESGSQYGLYGMSDLMRYIGKIGKLNKRMKILGGLLLRHDERQNMCRANKGIAKEEVGSLIPFTISSSTKVGRSALEKCSVHSVDRTAKVAREFKDVARYVMTEMGIYQDTGDTDAAELAGAAK